MANNVFQIVISATDKATDTVRKVNRSLSRLSAPFQEVGKSFKSLGRELGFQKIGKDLNQIGQTASRAARGVGSIVAPMAAVTGVASIAGIISLADGWAKLGRSVTYSAQNIGIGTGKLQEYEGAAKLAGLASGAMTQGLQTLGDTMEDALYGRNQQALMLFNRLGVGIKRTKDGAVDAAAEFKALSAAIYKIKNPQVQNLVAGNLGLTQLLPLIRMGPAAMDKLTQRARELGLVMDGPALQAANEYAAGLSQLEAAGTGLKNSIGSALIPALAPLVSELSVWVSKNRELIASKAGEWARELGQWVGSIDWQKVGNGIKDLASGVVSLVDHLGGWKTAAIGVAVVMNASLITSVLSLTGSLAKGGLGLLTFIGQLGQAQAAASGLSGSLMTLGRGGLYAAAAAGGWWAGNKIADGLEGTRVWDMATHGFAKNTGRLLGAFGFKDNVFSRAATYDGYDQKYNGAASPVGVDPALTSRVVDYYMKQGWSRAQALGIAANLMKESGLNSRATGDNGAAYGIGQWHADRQAAFEKWAGHSIQGSSLNDQLAFVQYELTRGNETGAGARLQTATNAAEAGAIVSRYYERPANADGEAAARGALANKLDGDLKVHVVFENAPPGTKAKVTTEGNVGGTPRIAYTGVGGNAG